MFQVICTCHRTKGLHDKNQTHISILRTIPFRLKEMNLDSVYAIHESNFTDLVHSPAIRASGRIRTDINVSDVLPLPNSIADFLQSTLTTRGDLLEKLLTNDILGSNVDPTGANN